MPSINDSRRQVEEHLRTRKDEIDHDAVLASLQDEIDKHNVIKDDFKRSMRGRDRDKGERSQHRSPRFRFKDEDKASKHRRKHSDQHGDDGDRRRHRKRKREVRSPPEDDGAAHPFPREPMDPTRPDPSTDGAAFRESLFDALADDEGAAYWESVYGEPIHVWARPTVQTEKGELEQMTDEQYTEYVKTKMWERKHPEIVLERERNERKKREEEEERTRRREEFVRRKEQTSWKRAQRRTFKGGSEDDEDDVDGRYEYEFAGEKAWTSESSANRSHKREYADAWAHYLAAWDRLKHEILSERRSNDEPSQASKAKASRRIPWPVIASKPAIRANIEDFMRHAPTNQQRSMTQVLKAERVRWHPDKVQQRFGGEVDEGTMKLVTGVFQVVDGLLEEERKNGR